MFAGNGDGYSSGSEEEHHSPVYNANKLGGLDGELEILHEQEEDGDDNE